MNSQLSAERGVEELGGIDEGIKQNKTKKEKEKN